MGKLSRAHFIETAIWLAIVAVGFYYSFDFNQHIEIYKFGASGWPRAILLLIALAVIGNLIWHYLHGDPPADPAQPSIDQAAGPVSSLQQPNAPGAAIVTVPHVEDEPRSAYYARIIPIIILPFIYGYLLEGVGFYSLTPLFIALVIFIMGERSWRWLAGITALIYGLLLFLFAKVLFVGLPVGNWHPFYDFSQWLIPVIQSSYVLEFLGLVLVIPLTIFAITRAKGTINTPDALRKTAFIYAALFVFGILASYLLAGPSKIFILFDVLKWPLSIIA